MQQLHTYVFVLKAGTAACQHTWHISQDIHRSTEEGLHECGDPEVAGTLVNRCGKQKGL